MKKETKKIGCWEEVVGKLRNLEEEQESIVLVFDGVGKIKIHSKDENLLQKLRQAQGKYVAVLHTDNPKKEYIFKVIT